MCYNKHRLFVIEHNEENMSKKNLEKEILSLVEVENFISVKNIAKNLNISEMTVRRHLNSLDSDNKLIRTHGGASRIELYKENPCFVRQGESICWKKTIALEAIQHICDGQTIILDAGSTCFALAKLLIQKKNLTIITQDITIATLLFPYHQVYISGGAISQNYGSVNVDFNDPFLNSIHADLLFLGISSISEDGMLSSPLPERAALKKLYLSKAYHSILLADSSKFRKNSFIDICSIDKFEIIYTDELIDKDIYNKFIKNKVNIKRVKKSINE